MMIVVMMTIITLFLVVMVLLKLGSIIHKSTGKRSLEDCLTKPVTASETGGNHRFLFLDDAQPSFHFGHDSLLFGEGWKGNG